ncbi:MAG: hypothetical protein NTU44_15630 [Bacteroidetes bacterium]|nr:hypothetical protein [Bacteroidota bacterium]
MDTIIKALRARGYEIKVDHKTCVVIHNEEIKFRLREKYKREANPKSTSMWDQYIYNPTSVLVFKIESWYREYDFIDGKCQLEELIPQIIAKIELIGDYLLQRRIESDRAREEQKEKERIRQEQLRIKERELKNFKKLLQSASRWHQAAFTRTFLTDFELKSRKADTFTDQKKSWVEWAKKKVDWYDPLVESFDEILKDVDRNTLL